MIAADETAEEELNGAELTDSALLVSVLETPTEETPSPVALEITDAALPAEAETGTMFHPTDLSGILISPCGANGF